jgi:hypothetical protein
VTPATEPAPPYGTYARDDLEVLGQRVGGGSGGEAVGFLLEFAGTSEDCERLAGAVRRNVKAFEGNARIGTDTFVHSMRIVAEVDGWLPLGDGDENGRYTTTMHIVVVHDGGA